MAVAGADDEGASLLEQAERDGINVSADRVQARPDPDGFLDFFASELAAPMRALTPPPGHLLIGETTVRSIGKIFTERTVAQTKRREGAPRPVTTALSASCSPPVTGPRPR
jgi:hypothetical protein